MAIGETTAAGRRMIESAALDSELQESKQVGDAPSLDADIHPDEQQPKANKDEELSTLAVGRNARETALRELNPLAPDLFHDESLNGLNRPAILEAGKAAVLALATQRPEAAREPLTPGRLIQEEFHLSQIQGLRAIAVRRGLLGASDGAQVDIEDQAIDALFERENTYSHTLAFPGVADRLQMGNGASFATLDINLAKVRDLASSRMPDHHRERDQHQFPSLGNSDPVPSDREVARMKPRIMLNFLQSGRGVSLIGPGGSHKEQELSPDMVIELAKGDGWREYQELRRRAA